MGSDEQPRASNSEQSGSTHASGSQVTVKILRELLSTGTGDACLALEAGRVKITSDSGGLVLISRKDLLDRVGTDPDATAMIELADLLNTEIRLQGA